MTNIVKKKFGKGKIILKPKSTPRKGWEKAFRQMNDNEDDKLMIDDVFDDEIFEEKQIQK